MKNDFKWALALFALIMLLSCSTEQDTIEIQESETTNMRTVTLDDIPLLKKEI